MPEGNHPHKKASLRPHGTEEQAELKVTSKIVTENWKIGSQQGIIKKNCNSWMQSKERRLKTV